MCQSLTKCTVITFFYNYYFRTNFECKIILYFLWREITFRITPYWRLARHTRHIYWYKLHVFCFCIVQLMLYNKLEIKGTTVHSSWLEQFIQTKPWSKKEKKQIFMKVYLNRCRRLLDVCLEAIGAIRNDIFLISLSDHDRCHLYSEQHERYFAWVAWRIISFDRV